MTKCGLWITGYCEHGYDSVYSIYCRNQMHSIKYMNIKEAAPTYFSRSVPSTGNTICQVQNQLPMTSYHFQAGFILQVR